MAMENRDSPLRPSWFQAVLAFLILLINAVIVSLALLNLADNIRNFLPGYIVVVLALVVMNCQYLGMFRFSRACTTFMLWPLSITFVFSCAFLLSSIQWIETARSVLVFVPMGILVLLSVITGCGFRANWQWRKSLKVAKEQGTLPERETSFTLLEMMLGTLLLAVAIGPACYHIGAKYPVYRENLSADQVPFPVPQTAQDITYRIEPAYKQTIRAIWQQKPADLDVWLDSLETDPGVNRFVRNQHPLRNAEARIPQPPSLYGQRWIDETIPRAYRATWNYGDREVAIKWDVETHSGMTTVYYYESDPW